MDVYKWAYKLTPALPGELVMDCFELSWRIREMDMQASPYDLAAWGYEPEANWGTLRTAAGEQRVPSEQGRYHDYYAAFARAVHEGGAAPVTAAEAVDALAVLDAARLSATEGRSVGL